MSKNSRSNFRLNQLFFMVSPHKMQIQNKIYHFALLNPRDNTCAYYICTPFSQVRSSFSCWVILQHTHSKSVSMQSKE